MKPQLTYYDIDPSVSAFSTTRHGGCGTGAYGEFNINRYCGDTDEAVSRNLELLSRELGIDASRIIMPHQNHGITVRQIAADFLTLPQNIRTMILEGTDALITDVKGVCIGVSTADCIPVLLFDPVHKAVGAVHAGWRGTVRCVVGKAIDAMWMTYGSRPADLKAVIGPGISVDAFEVGDEVYTRFEAAGFDMKAVSRRKEKWHIDLPLCNSRQMQALGVAESNITMTGICTYNNPDDYFSARRLGADSGRIFTAVSLKA